MTTRAKKPVAERFWLKVHKTDGCWQWTGAIDGKGYGRIWVEPRLQTASRVSWFLNTGQWPGGMFVCHHCDNRACVRPDHLFLGTQSDNLRDAYNKGRHAPPSSAGERNCHAVLTEASARRIRELRGEKTASELAVLFRVSKSTIYHVLSGYTWKAASAQPGAA